MKTTTKAAHTPGPWSVRDYGLVRVHIEAGEKKDAEAVAEVWKGNPANAHLIAAAPDLLAACEIAHEALKALRGHADDTTADIITAAIAKATGGAA